MLKDYSNASTIENGPYGEDWTSALIERIREKGSIFDVLAAAGIPDVLTMNPSSLQATGMNGQVISMSEDGYTQQAPLAHRYLIKEISKLGLGGEYNTLQGVKPEFKSMRYIDFVYGKEETVTPLGYDPVVDTDIQGLINSATNDWATAIVKQREPRFYDQVVNSGVLIKDVATLNGLHDFVGTGYDAAGTATNLLTLSDEEFGQMILGISQYPMSINYSGMFPIMVSTAVFNKIRDNQYLKDRMTMETIETTIKNRKFMELEGNCMLVEVPRNIMPAKVDMILIIPGTAVMFESIVRPIKVRSALQARAAGYEANVLYDGDFVGGTYQQVCMITDNFDTATGDVYSDGLNGGLTDLFVLVNLDGTLVQDTDLVLKGNVHGSTPANEIESNRTLRQKIMETADNSLASTMSVETDSVKPMTAAEKRAAAKAEAEAAQSAE